MQRLQRDRKATLGASALVNFVELDTDWLPSDSCTVDGVIHAAGKSPDCV